MPKSMLIDAAQPDEVRVAIVHNTHIEHYDSEFTHQKPLKGNIYLAKVTRVEPSLQAAFVDYGGERHGFLALSEIHPDYYRIPIADLEKLKSEAHAEQHQDDGFDEDVDGEDDEDAADDDMGPWWRRAKFWRHYKIQEVVRRGQILLIQISKENRGTKGAAATTYISLAGRYCVLMPNTTRQGGISRKIINAQDRKRLKSIISDIKLPEGIALVVRTAGADKSRAHIKRDYEYLARTWDRIRETTLNSIAPALINEEAGILRRNLRDHYDTSIEDVIVEGEESYKIVRTLMKEFLPSHVRKVKKYEPAPHEAGLFQRENIEIALAKAHLPKVALPSGGYLVIHQTEALVAIDVNSGRSIRESHIDDTALKTNLEAAEEACRQMRIRDLSGLIVIDFIDMDHSKHNTQLEKRMAECTKRDRARIQRTSISALGLMELSRQRMRPILADTLYQSCNTCMGLGYVPSPLLATLLVLRMLGVEGSRPEVQSIDAVLPENILLHMLNNKRSNIVQLEKTLEITITIRKVRELEIMEGHSSWRLDMYDANQNILDSRDMMSVSTITYDSGQSSQKQRDSKGEKSSSRRRRKRSRDQEPDAQPRQADSNTSEASDTPPKRRRRRGGRGRSNKSAETSEATTA